MSDYKWNSDQIIHFLDIYKQYTCLWDASSDGYLKREKRQVAMQKLVCDLEEEGFGTIAVDKLQKKIKSIKDAYRFELNKVKTSMKSGTGTEDVYKPRLAWYHAADVFWKKVVQGRESTSNLDEVMLQDSTIPTGTQENITSPETCNIQSVVEVTNSQRQVNTHSTLQMRSTPKPALHKLKSPQKKKVVKPLKPTRFETNIKKLESIANLAANDPDDEYEKYGKHIAAQLRAMPLRSFILLQQQINNLITTERLNLIDSTMPLTSYSPQVQRPNSAHSSIMTLDSMETSTDIEYPQHDSDDFFNLTQL